MRVSEKHPIFSLRGDNWKDFGAYSDVKDLVRAIEEFRLTIASAVNATIRTEYIGTTEYAQLRVENPDGKGCIVSGSVATWITSNSYFDGTAWQLYDTSKDGFVVGTTEVVGPCIYRFPATAGTLSIEGPYVLQHAIGFTTTELADKTHHVNTTLMKVEGWSVFNSTTKKPVWAVGNADTDVWVNATGATEHTPV